ncbi:multi-sensor hybrid histidine kinase [Stylonychia lemnae]|uniref:Multi-sensor hybrid histidine kinase n=1 Tax=Stylonychia lemnae TaxID=5949 RepID=A0A078ANS2_STYLE|nr:multi-sensor hybrid histidine kinase [Stylonychia lemnae]|eukprot:CDW83581.1 multi-sensor hybrid histidine kinase [Stylonychia lemnae]
MNSKITLKIKDPIVRANYLLKRSREILFLSLLVFLIRIVMFAGVIIASFIKQRPSTPNVFIIASAGLLWHIILMILTYRFPRIFTLIHAPLLAISYFFTCLTQFYSPNSYVAVIQSTIGLEFFLISGLVLSFCWYITSIALLLNLIFGLVILVVKYDIDDVGTIGQYLMTTFFIIYACYENNQVVQGNKELNKLLSIKDDQDNSVITQRLTEQIFQPYNNYIEGLGDSEQDSGLQINSIRLNIHEALQRNDPNEFFQIKTKYNFEDGRSHSSQEQPQYSEIFTLKQQELQFQSKPFMLILFNRITSFIKYEKLKMENNFYEMITATVSHDMRTPINAIMGIIESLDPFISKQEGKKLLQIVDNSSKILLFLVNDILDFFQIKNGKFKINYDKVKIRKPIQELIDMFQLVSHEKKVEILCEFDENVPEQLLVDEQRLRQILINLISNSLKFTLQGSIKILSKYEQSQKTLFVTVKDTGIGVNDEDEIKLFKLFGKLESSQALNTKGIGLGLNICSKIVEACGGEIHLDHEYKEGASFQFSILAYENENDLPKNQSRKKEVLKDQLSSYQSEGLDENELPVKFNSIMLSLNDYSDDKIDFDQYLGSIHSVRNLNTEPELSCPCRNRPQILIVDDNVFNIITLQTILEMNFKQKVEKATNGKEGVDKVMERIELDRQEPCHCDKNNHNFKIIFMDCNMPIMDGFQATQEIRQFEKQNNIVQTSYIVALTAYSTDMFSQKCKESGMDNFMTKPISVDTIQKILSRTVFK